jgi:hypothetical protein
MKKKRMKINKNNPEPNANHINQRLTLLVVEFTVY